MADAVYRSFIGFVKFDPNDADAAGTPVRSFVIRNVGVKEQALDVRCTLWPSHDDFDIKKGNAVLVEGKFTVNKAKNKDQETVTYFNLSVSNILSLGEGFRGERVETENTTRSNDADEVAEDEIPY